MFGFIYLVLVCVNGIDAIKRGLKSAHVTLQQQSERYWDLTVSPGSTMLAYCVLTSYSEH